MPTRTRPRLPQPSVEDVVAQVRGLLHRVFESAADRLVLAALRHGDTKAIVLPEDEYEAFMATLEVDEDKEALDDLRAGLEETRHGLPPTWEDLEGELGPLGSTQTDKAL
jgi:PHD/YefM family antitoxin component YafN of YafNO toxin-antitoxin module